MIITKQTTTTMTRTHNLRLVYTGFLPFFDQNQHSTGGNLHETLAKRMNLRTNHALWDQLGLLRWLRRNAAAFGGNTRNVSLVALDNQAAQCIQLLAMSPLSQG